MEEYANEEKFQGALILTAVFFFPIPKSYSKARKERIKKEKEYFVKSPDLDNLMKSIADALNAIAYEDDKQIFEAHIVKKYTEGNPRAEVLIEEIE
jgi:Holliday junction resolvase RusA-like endonuclease